MQPIISLIKTILRWIKRFIAYTVKKFYAVFITTFAIVFGVLFAFGFSLIPMIDQDMDTTQDYSTIRFEDSEPQLDFEYYAGSRDGETKVAHLNLDGIIVEESVASDPFGFFDAGGIISGGDVRQALDTLAQYSEIEALMISLTTPGGSPIGSQMVAEAIESYREQTGNQVFIYVNSLSASGGAWIQSVADVVIARDSATLGSVGVAAGFAPQITDVTQYTPSGIIGQGVKGNINFRAIGRGDCKLPESPLNISNDFIANCIDREIDQIYTLFLNQISSNQDVSTDRLREIGARTFLASDPIARETGFVDVVGNEAVALETIRETLDLPALPTILSVQSASRSPFESLFGLTLDSLTSRLTSTSAKTDLAICNQFRPLVLHGNIEQLTSPLCAK